MALKPKKRALNEPSLDERTGKPYKTPTTYSPKPMSAAAKAKAKAAGAKTAAKIKNPMGLKQMNFDKKAKKK